MVHSAAGKFGLFWQFWPLLSIVSTSVILPISASTKLFDKVAANSADRNNANLQNNSSHLLNFHLTRKTEWWQAVNDILCQW